MLNSASTQPKRENSKKKKKRRSEKTWKEKLLKQPVSVDIREKTFTEWIIEGENVAAK